MGSPYARKNEQERRERIRQEKADVASGRAYYERTGPRGSKKELKYRTDEELKSYLGPEKYADYQLRQKFGVQPEYGQVGGKTQHRSKTGPATSELQEYEQGIQGVVKSQQAMTSSMRARMAASGHSQEQIDAKIQELQGNFQEEIAYMYAHGGKRLKDVMDPYAALMQRRKYYEQKAGTMGMDWSGIQQEGQGWKKWW